jgi:hypothetical protein
MDSVDGKIYGKYNTVTSINPYNCHFIAKYPNGLVIKGKNFIDTGWNNIPNGLCELSYSLSTGHTIVIPKFKAYLPLIEVSFGMDGSRIFHSVNVKCLAENEIFVYKIILKEDNISKFKIGDIVLSKTTDSINNVSNYTWKFTS